VPAASHAIHRRPAPPKVEKRNAARLNSVSNIVNKFATEPAMAQEFKPGEIVPQSGI
jgi:hypothetical protein